jgi:dihydrofolate reductase/GNAT superfamily N-acetyltransferase
VEAEMIGQRIVVRIADQLGAYSFRSANEFDSSKLGVLVNTAYGHYVERIGILPRPMTDDYAEVIRNHRVTVAESHGTIVGVIVLTVNDEGFLIDNVAVDPPHRGKGLGKALLEFAETEARRAGFDSIYLYTHEKMTENLALYSRIGYVEYDRRSQGEFSLVYMRKNRQRTKMDATEAGEMQGRTEEVSMRKVVASEFVSLDGVMESPEKWHFPYFNEEMGEAIGSAMTSADGMLLGRVTYEEWAAHWPYQSLDENQVANYMNDTPKYVVSKTLQEPLEWQNSTLIKENVAEEIARLKQQPGKDISITGSPTLVRSLLQEVLLDELRLMVHPIVVGSGKRLFEDGSDQKALELVDSRIFSTGVVYLTYRPAGKQENPDRTPSG